MGSNRFISALASVANYLPAAEKPARKPSLREKLAWTGVALVVYLVLSDIPIFGIPPQVYQQFGLLNLIFASKQGTLMQLGIGPIVTAGMIMQILVGSKILNLDLSNTQDRIDFTAAQKTFAVIFTMIQASAYIVGGIFGPLTTYQDLLVFVQLVFATLIVILLDEMLQKGWGIGSGISLFILAGVAFQFVYSAFSYQPFSVPNGVTYAYGAVIAAIQAAMSGNLASVIVRFPPSQYSPPAPDLVGLLVTVIFIVLLVYLLGMKVQIPVVYQKAQGYRSKIPLQFMYVSNVPVLLAGILFSDYIFFSEIIWSRLNPSNTIGYLNILGTFTRTTNAGVQPTGGLAYFIQNPVGLGMTIQEPIRAIVFIALLTLLSVMFAYMWVEISGLGPRDQAEQLANSGLQIAGFRSSIGIIESVLRKPIYALTLISSLLAGIIAGVADVLGAFGTGMGLLLAINIVYQIYQILVQEQIEEVYPGIAKLLE
jgi:preprotein translocase subunit SecY